MHVRISRVTRNGKTYRYAQLVESFRRASDGMPAHRVIASLGDPGELATQNLCAALAAATKGRRVAMVARQPRAALARPIRPTRSLRYLDLAVLLELWRQMGLSDLFDELMPHHDGQFAASSAVAALVLQRCLDPGSKLYASRWIPRTALPELLGVPPDQFNNTRIHRVLDQIDDVTATLMAKLPHRYLDHKIAFAALFLDVSDTWFVGNGPSIASRGKTKEGMMKKKIGVVLLCNQDGFPLRWDVIPGNEADPTAMTRTFRGISGAQWAAKVPIVCDRAMGSTAVIRKLAETGLHFVTALTKNEFDSFAPTLPHHAFGLFDLDEKLPRETHVERAAHRAVECGLTRHAEDLYVLDLGVVDRDALLEVSASDLRASASPVAEAMRLARLMNESIDQRHSNSIAAAGRKVGLKPGVAKKYLRIRGLSEQQQREVLDGKLDHCTLDSVIAVAKIADPDQRATAFDDLARSPTASQSVRKRESKAKTAPDDPPARLRVRAVAYFNPDRFIQQRLAAQQQIQSVNGFLERLQARVTASPRRYSAEKIHGLIDSELREKSLLEAFEIRVTRAANDQGPPVIALVLDEKNWATRRRYDGFSVIVAHPDLSMDPADLCRLYRAKNAVEKDFRIIKSVVELRPVWHRTESKIRAHVTLCVLAMLLERVLEQRLATHQITDVAALEILRDCQLNHYAASEAEGVYTLTELDTEQRATLRALRMLPLADDSAIAAAIRPR
jgi:transposase